MIASPKPKKIKVAGYRGLISPIVDHKSFLDFLKVAFKNNFTELTPISERPERQVMYFTWEGKGYFIKRYLSRGLRSYLKYKLGISKASLSFKTPGYLAKFSVNTPKPMLILSKHYRLFELEEIYISQEIPTAISLRQFVYENIYSGRFSRKQRLDFFRSFARFLANIHRAGVYHGDFRADNIYLENTLEKDYPLYLIDLDAIKTIRWISREMRVKNLDEIGRNFKDLDKISFRDRARVVVYYLKFYKGEKKPLKVFLKEICDRTRSKL